MEKVLSGSKVGHPCDRKLWYAAQGLEEQVSPAARRTFAVGHALEPLVVQFMKEDGYTVFHNDKCHEDEPDFVIPLKGGVITGRHDIRFCSGSDDRCLVLGDIKTMNSMAYTLWRRYGTKKKYPQYVVQLTVYYHGLKEWAPEIGASLNGKLAVVGFNKDNSTYAIETFDYSSSLWEEIKERCERIFAASSPPVPEELPSWACSYCGYSHICEANPAKKDDVSAVEVDEEETEMAAELLAQAQLLKEDVSSLSKEVKNMEEKAKKVLGRYAGCYEVIKAGRYVVEITPSKRSVLDTKELKVKRPEIYRAFLREKLSYRYKVLAV